VCIWSDSLEEKVELTTWLNTWRKVMTFVSHDYGGGCCIHLFDLEGPKEAIDALPTALLAVSEWTENGTKPAKCPLFLHPKKTGAGAAMPPGEP
jgi:hypothetical protein